MELGIEQCRGILPRGGTILGSSRTNPFKIDGRRRADPGEPQERRRRRAGRHRRRGHPRRRDQARRPRRQRRRRTEDDRQRPVRHRLHVRLRHGGQHRHRGDRPAAHHRRVAPPGARGRGDGPARRLDRAALGHRRRRQRRPDPRAPLRHRRAVRYVEDRFKTRYSPIIVVSEGAVPADGGDMTLVSGEKDAFGHVRLGGIGDRLAARDRDPDRQGGPRGRPRPHPARRHAHARSTAGWPPASGSRPSTPSPRATSAR